MAQHLRIEGIAPGYNPQAGMVTVYDAYTDAPLFQGTQGDVDLFLEVSGLSEHDVELSTHHHTQRGFE